MKEKFQLIFLKALFILITNTLCGQENKNRINVSGLIAHYTRVWDIDYFNSGNEFPISPGIELSYSRFLKQNLELITGLNFQKVHHWSRVDLIDIMIDYSRKFRYFEISFPVLMRHKFTLINGNQWYLTWGAYSGRQLQVKSYYYQSVGWTEWTNLKTIAKYSEDHFFTDAYLDIGYLKTFNKGDNLSFSSFINYRVNTTWLNTYQKRIHWGIKVSYQFEI